jgi:hypothetical protein
MKTFRVVLITAIVILLITACTPATIAPTQAPYPTQTAYPTQLPWPTATPLPTATVVPTQTPVAKQSLSVENTIKNLGFTEVPGFSCQGAVCRAFDYKPLGMRVILVDTGEVDFFVDKGTYNVYSQEAIDKAILYAIGFDDDTVYKVINLTETVTADPGTVGDFSKVPTGKGRIIVGLDRRGSVPNIMVNFQPTVETS